MGIFDRFTGQGDRYTRAQRTGLRRSAEIKKKRKEEERTFEKTQEREKGRRALAERGMIEAGATRRTAMSEAGAVERAERFSVGMMARQRLIGEQGVEAARVGGVREADVASMKYGRGLTMSEKEHRQDVELAKIKARASLSGLFETSTDTIGGASLSGLFETSANTTGRAELAGEKGIPESILTDFFDMEDSKKKAYMDQLKKKDPDAYLYLAKQYKMLNAPKPEMPRGGLSMNQGGRFIYQSDGGIYRNF